MHSPHHSISILPKEMNCEMRLGRVAKRDAFYYCGKALELNYANCKSRKALRSSSWVSLVSIF